MVILTRFSAKVKPSKCQIEELRERGVPENMLSEIQESMIMWSPNNPHRHSYDFFISTVEGVPGGGTS